MSRDFTPEQHFLVDLSQKNAIRNSVLTWTSTEGKEIRIDNHLAKDRYPEFSFLYERFDELYKKYADNEKVLKLFDRIEGSIKEAEDQTMNGSLPFTTKFDTIVQNWFEGKLDPNFYYHETNDDLFSEFIEGEIKAMEHKGHGMIVVLAGASGSGKDTLRNELEEQGYERLVTYTTRSPREGEQDGIDYNFVSPEWFKDKIEDGSIFEYRQFGDKYYGSMKQELDPQKDYVIVLDDTGVEDYQKAFGKDKVFAVLVEVSDDVRYKRAYDRQFPDGDPYPEDEGAFDAAWTERLVDDKARFSEEFIDRSINFRLDNEYALRDVVKTLKEAQTAYEGAAKPDKHYVVSESLESGKLSYEAAEKGRERHKSMTKE